MEINNTKLNDNIILLEDAINRYEDNYLNRFNDLKITNSWSDPISYSLDERMRGEKVDEDELFNELQDLKKIYLYVYYKYKEIGNKIVVNLDKIDNLLSSITISISKLDDIIGIYEELLSYDEFSGNYMFKGQYSSLKKEKLSLIDIVDNIKYISGIVVKVEKIVNDFCKRLESNIIVISDNGSEIIPSALFVDKDIFMDVDFIGICLKKLYSYEKEISLLKNDFDVLLKGLCNNYISSNLGYRKDIREEIINNFICIGRNINNCIKIIEENKAKYESSLLNL